MVDYRQDIRHYSDDELSLLVFNDEYYYVERHDRDYLKALLDEQFVYTDDQYKVLIKDLELDNVHY